MFQTLLKLSSLDSVRWPAVFSRNIRALRISMAVLDPFMPWQCKHPSSAKEWHSKRLKIRSAVQTITRHCRTNGSTSVIISWSLYDFGKSLRNWEFSGFRLSTIKSYHRPTVPFSVFKKRVLRITVVGLNTFLAQWFKHPNLPKHHRSHRPETGSASRAISVIAKWMLKSLHI